MSALLGIAWFKTRAQAQYDASVAKQFGGTWRLVSRPERLIDGTTRQNPLSVAYLIFTDASHMCYVAMKPKRSNWQAADKSTTEELVSGVANSAFYAYCGTVEVHANEGFVVHHIEIDKSPN